MYCVVLYCIVAYSAPVGAREAVRTPVSLSLSSEREWPGRRPTQEALPRRTCSAERQSRNGKRLLCSPVAHPQCQTNFSLSGKSTRTQSRARDTHKTPPRGRKKNSCCTSSSAPPLATDSEYFHNGPCLSSCWARRSSTSIASPTLMVMSLNDWGCLWQQGLRVGADEEGISVVRGLIQGFAPVIRVGDRAVAGWRRLKVAVRT